MDIDQGWPDLTPSEVDTPLHCGSGVASRLDPGDPAVGDQQIGAHNALHIGAGRKPRRGLTGEKTCRQSCIGEPVSGAAGVKRAEVLCGQLAPGERAPLHPAGSHVADIPPLHSCCEYRQRRSAWWPWLKRRYGYTDEQTKPYTFNLQPFFADKTIAQQGYPSSEPFQALQRGVPAKFFLFADDGYSPYGSTMVTTTKLVAEKPDAVRAFVRASLEGWKSYLKGDPAPANALIKADNPKMSDEQIAFGIKRMNELKVLDGGDAATKGIGIMTEARWRVTYDFLVAEGLLDKSVDWRKGFTTEFVKDLRIVAN
jgi:NMT1/THI5 like protein